MADVALRNVVKRFDDVDAVRNISLTIPDNEFVVLVGPSGCGKSTTLRMIAGLEEATAGDILIGGEVVNDVPPKDRDIAMVFQNYALYPHMTVFENMSFGLRLRRVAKAEIRARVEQAAKILDITDLLGRRPKQLSGGQRQRVAIARALILEPRILLLDEPTSALDVSVQAEILNLLADLRDARGLTYLLVSHDLGVIAHLCSRVAILARGKLATAGRLSDMLAFKVRGWELVVSGLSEEALQRARQRDHVGRVGPVRRWSRRRGPGDRDPGEHRRRREQPDVDRGGRRGTAGRRLRRGRPDDEARDGHEHRDDNDLDPLPTTRRTHSSSSPPRPARLSSDAGR